MNKKVLTIFSVIWISLFSPGITVTAESLSYHYDDDGRLVSAMQGGDSETLSPSAAHNFSSSVSMGDANTNGMPDTLEAYLAGYWGPDYDPFTCDSDGDGVCDWNEWMMGTDPFSADSRFVGWSGGGSGGGGPLEPYDYTIYWSSLPFKTYDVQFKPDLMDTNWTLGATNLPATPPVNSWTHEATTNRHNFYRVQTKIELPPSTNTVEEGGEE
jgi:hypothetical protein